MQQHHIHPVCVLKPRNPCWLGEFSHAIENDQIISVYFRTIYCSWIWVTTGYLSSWKHCLYDGTKRSFSRYLCVMSPWQTRGRLFWREWETLGFLTWTTDDAPRDMQHTIDNWSITWLLYINKWPGSFETDSDHTGTEWCHTHPSTVALGWTLVHTENTDVLALAIQAHLR